jgi:tetratricopeptide (TPR) repeat protein
VLVLHGLVDDAFYGYGGAGALALFVPFALLSRPGQHAPPRARRARRRTAVVLAAVVAVLLLALPAVRSAWRSNLGALRQSRVELRAYSWPASPIQDATRRDVAPRLAPAIRDYESALRLHARNVTANRRLGQIQLSLGRYEVARQRLLAALEADPGGHATRRLAGEALAVTGDVARAAEVWRPLRLGPEPLAHRQFWYDAADPGQRADWMRAAIALATAQRHPGPATRLEPPFDSP